MGDIFGEELSLQNLNQTLEYATKPIEEENKSEMVLKGKSQQISSLMQFNRLHKILAARACEHIFILRSCFSLVKNDIIAVAFPKKNPFAMDEAQLNNAINNAVNQTTNEVDKQMQNILGIGGSQTFFTASNNPLVNT